MSPLSLLPRCLAGVSAALLVLVLAAGEAEPQGATEDDRVPLDLTPTANSSSNACKTDDGRDGVCLSYTQCTGNQSVQLYPELDDHEVRLGNCPGLLLTWCCVDDLAREPDDPQDNDRVGQGPLPSRRRKPNMTEPVTGAVTEGGAGPVTGAPVVVTVATGLGDSSGQKGQGAQRGCGLQVDPFRLTADRAVFQYGECPWCVALYRDGGHPGTKSPSGYFCTGVLVHARVVLTTAQCVLAARGSRLVARVGDYDLSRTEELFPHEELDVSDTVMHPNYSSGTQRFNAALLVLSRPALLSGEGADAGVVGVACLARVGQPVTRPSSCEAPGWGRGVDGVYRDVPAKVQLSPVEAAGCEAQYQAAGARLKLREDRLCAEGADTTRDTCPAGAGSPLQCATQGGSRVAVWGLGAGWLAASRCAGGAGGALPAVFTDVRAVRPWLDAQMTARGFGTDSYTEPA